jgi:hypothetical protein
MNNEKQEIELLKPQNVTPISPTLPTDKSYHYNGIFP